jgi:hypothetical protein
MAKITWFVEVAGTCSSSSVVATLSCHVAGSELTNLTLVTEYTVTNRYYIPGALWIRQSVAV